MRFGMTYVFVLGFVSSLTSLEHIMEEHGRYQSSQRSGHYIAGILIPEIDTRESNQGGHEVTPKAKTR